MKYDTLSKTVYSIKTEHELRDYLTINGYSGKVIDRWVELWKEDRQSPAVQDLFAYNSLEDDYE